MIHIQLQTYTQYIGGHIPPPKYYNVLISIHSSSFHQTYTTLKRENFPAFLSLLRELNSGPLPFCTIIAIN